tara:strand:- start:216 stop:593 length:378 start_codon:yes stop_codon:yes gene_type:complete
MSSYNKLDNSIDNTNKTNITEIKENSKFEIIDVNNTYKKYYEKKNKTRLARPYLTKFEKCKILGIRTEQLASGALPLVDLDNTETSALEIAEREFIEKKIPFIIRRYLPNNTYEDWKLKELIYNC